MPFVDGFNVKYILLVMISLFASASYGSRLIENIIPFTSEGSFGTNSETVPAPTNDVPLANAPFGITKGFQYVAGSTGLSQRNFIIPADSDAYEWSIIMYIPEETKGAKFYASLLGIVGVDRSGTGAFYDFDTDYGLIQPAFVTSLGGGYYRASRIFKNNGTGTIFSFRLDGGQAGMEKIVFTGHQLVKIPVATAPLDYRIKNYASNLVKAWPYNGTGNDGFIAVNDAPQNFNQINAWGDSFIGAGALHKWSQIFGNLYGKSMVHNGVGGDTSTQIKDRMILSSTTATDIVIIEAGINNWFDPETIKADIAEMVSTIPHDHYIVSAVIGRNNNADFQIGGSAWTTLVTLNTDLAAIYPNNFVDIRRALTEAYDPNIPAEVTAHNLDITTTRLQDDGLHPTDDGQYAICRAIWDSMVSRKMVTNLPITPSSILQFSSASYNTEEGNASVVITVLRNNGSLGLVTVDYYTVDDTAVAKNDYLPVNGFLVFADGETSKTIEIPLLDDETYEGDESFNIVLSNAQGGAALGLPVEALIMINEDDSNSDGDEGGALHPLYLLLMVTYFSLFSNFHRKSKG